MKKIIFVILFIVMAIPALAVSGEKEKSKGVYTVKHVIDGLKT